MNLFDLSAKLSLDSSDYEEGISAAQRGVQALEGAVKLFVFGKAAQAFLGFARDAVNTGMAFDSAMSQVAATMGVSADEIGNLRDFAKEMGATTRFSAVEAAQALNYMALAGYDAEKSMETLPTVLNLASAGGMDLARASDMVTDAESALGLTSEQTAAMVDQMARTASKSNTSVEQLGDAMLTIGGTARFMAGGTDRLQTVLGLLADNGIKGSEAGTHLRNMLVKLSSPTKDGAKLIEELGLNIFDAEGNMRDMQDIMLDMNGAMSNLTQEDRVKALSELFNTRDLSAVNALLGTSKERWEELGSTIAEASGSAEQMAGTQLGNLTGDITIMKSALEGVKIEFAEGITPSLRDLVQRLTRALSNPKTQKFLRDVGEALGNVITYVTNLVSRVLLPKAISLFEDGGKKIKTFGGIVAGLVVTIKTVNTVMGLMAGTVSPTGMLIKGIGLLIGLFTAADLAQEAYIANMEYLTDEQRELVDGIESSVEAHQKSKDSYGESVKAIVSEKDATKDLWKELQTLVTEDGHVLEGNEARVDYILGELNDALGTEYERNGDIIAQYGVMREEIGKLIAQKSAEALLDARRDLYTEALQNREQALMDASEAYEALQAAQKTESEQSQAAATFFALQKQAYVDGNEEMARTYNALGNAAQDAADKARLQIDKLQETYDNANSQAADYYAEVERYEGAQMAMYEGNYAKVNELLSEDYSASLDNYLKKKNLTEAERIDFQDKLKKQEGYVAQYRRNYEAGMKGFSKPVLDELEAQLAEARRVGNNIGKATADGVADQTEYVKQKARNLINSMFSTMKSVAQIASPSKRGRGMGRNIGGSVGLGLEDEYESTMKIASQYADGIFDNLQTTVPGIASSRGGSAWGGGLSDVVGLLEAIKDKIPRDLVLDSGVIAGSVDKALGQLSMRKARGNA